MAIIFWDFDGTLAYSNHLWSTTVYNSLKEAAPNSKMNFHRLENAWLTDLHGIRLMKITEI